MGYNLVGENSNLKGVKEEAMLERVTIDPEICHGKPCIKGTRIPVFVILDLLAANLSKKQIIEAYPDLTIEDIKAAIEYAALITREKTVMLKAG